MRKQIELPQVPASRYYECMKSLDKILRARGVRLSDLPQKRQDDLVYGMALMAEAVAISAK